MPITLLSKEILRSKYVDPSGASTLNDYIQFRFRVQNTTSEDIKSFDNSFIEVTKGGVTKQYIFKISVPAGTTSSLFTTIKYLLPEDFWTGAVTVKFIFPISATGGQNIVTTNFSGDWAKYYLGCTNPEALNYNPDADSEDGSCILPVYGCTNPEAINYDPEANTDDGSCVLPVPGCTNPEALNYDPDANTDDGSCILDNIDPTIAAYNLEITQISGGYRFDLWVDLFNGSAHPKGPLYVYLLREEDYGLVYYAFSLVVYSNNKLQPGETRRLSRTETVNNLADTGNYKITLRSGPPTTGTTVVYDSETFSAAPLIYGCTDPEALNYNPNATSDDGSCTYGPPPERTGLKGWATLEEYDILNDQLTGNEKDNDPEDADYVPPVYDPNACPPGDAPL